MKITILLLIVFPLVIQAKIKDYIFSQADSVYTPITGGVVLGTSGNVGVRFNNLDMNLGTGPAFSFVYNNRPYTKFSVNSAGFIALGSTVLYPQYGKALGDSNGTNNVIAAFALGVPDASECLKGRLVGSDLECSVIGNPGSRMLVIQWTNYQIGNSTATANSANFQIRLYETTNIIQIIYGQMVFPNPSDYYFGYPVEVGLRGYSNLDFNNRMTTKSWDSTSAGTNNSSYCTVGNLQEPRTGRCFTWTPPASKPMTYVSSATYKFSKSDILLNSKNNQIMGLQIIADGSLNPFSLTKLDLSSFGSTNFNRDIKNVKVYSTGYSQLLDTTTLFGSASNCDSPITGNVQLCGEANYFWVTYDLSPKAMLGDSMVAQCKSITMSGTIGTQIPTVDTCTRIIGYCESKGWGAASPNIGNVTFGTLNNGNPTPQKSNPTSVNHYSDFRYLSPPKVQKGSLVPISISDIYRYTNVLNSYHDVYIDYNQDGVFDLETELVFNKQGPSVQGTVSIPWSALTGKTFMRVISYSNLNSNCPGCQICAADGGDNNEVEDYAIQILPLTDLFANVTTICPGVTVTFSDTLASSFGRVWDFPGGYPSSSTERYPKVRYETPGNYDVTLIDSSMQGTETVVETDMKENYITVGNSPTVTIEKGSSTSCSTPLRAITSQADSGTITGYQWYKDDVVIQGATESTYDAGRGGMYTVGVANSSGCSSLSYSVHVYEGSKPSAIISGDTVYCEGDTLTLSSTYSVPGNGSISGRQWLKDGVAIPNATSVTYQVPDNSNGMYRVVVTNTAGCTDTSAIRRVVFSTRPVVNLGKDITSCDTVTLVAGSGAQYKWSTGEITQKITVTKTGNYSVTVTNEVGCSGSDTIHVTYNGLDASITASDTVTVNKDVVFHSNSATATTWHWDFGDGGTSQQSDVTYRYTSIGTYVVTLVISNETCSEKVKKTIVVVVPSDVREERSEELAQLNIYPNPNNGKFTLDINFHSFGMAHIRITNVLGISVYEERANNISILKREIDLHTYSQGMYHVQIETMQGSIVKKIFIQ